MTVHLLKNKTDDVGRPDPYEQIEGAQFVPILNYVPVQFDALVQYLRQAEFDAIIVTSQRAVDVLKDVLPLLENKNLLKLPTWTVGPATAARLELAGFKCVKGSDTGNGMALAAQMLQQLSSPLRFAFFAGEVHRPQLPEKLVQNGHTVHTQIVYKTEKLDFAPQLSKNLKEHDWVVFFSPSYAQDVPLHQGVRVAAIGPTTRDYLESNGITVQAMAAHPTAEALNAAIKAVIENK